MMKNENPFKKLGLPLQEVPKELKQKVMDDINTVKFIIEVTSLFSSNYAETIEGMFKTKSKNNNDTNQ
jgi:hypothetical protein